MKELLLAFSLFAFSTSAHAGFGIHGGANLGNLTIEPTNELTTTQSAMGYMVGVHTSFGPGILMIEPGIQYAQRGFGLDVLGTTANFFVNYVEVPLMVKLILPLPGIKPFLVAGPNVGYKIGTSSTVSGDYTCTIVNDDVANLNYGAEFGAGIKIGLGLTALTLEARYYLGLANYNNGADKDTVKFKHKGIEFLAGFNF